MSCETSFVSPKCGGEPTGDCNDWQTFQYLWQYCDDPSSGTEWAVDLRRVFGQDCRFLRGGRGCCFMPLGYAGGPAVGDDCAKVCAGAMRVGHASSYCERSDRKHEYGNCFCGEALPHVVEQPGDA